MQIPAQSRHQMDLQREDSVQSSCASRAVLLALLALASVAHAAPFGTGCGPIPTVAGTIFPMAMYQRYGRPGYYDKYKEMLKRGQAANTWGTYAHRMIERPGREPGTTINPLDYLVNKLAHQPQPADGKKVSFVATYELGVADAEEDLQADADAGGDVPTYNPALDMREWLGLPCLSHLSFKRVPRGEGHAVDLTAIYRSHHYCARALGNL